MSKPLPHRTHGTHLPPQAYLRPTSTSTPLPQDPSSWFEPTTPADPPPPNNERSTEDVDSTMSSTDTEILPVVPADGDTQIIPAVSDQPEKGQTRLVPARENTSAGLVLSDPRDIAFRDRILANLRRIKGFG